MRWNYVACNGLDINPHDKHQAHSWHMQSFSDFRKTNDAFKLFVNFLWAASMLMGETSDQLSDFDQALMRARVSISDDKSIVLSGSPPRASARRWSTDVSVEICTKLVVKVLLWKWDLSISEVFKFKISSIQ